MNPGSEGRRALFATALGLVLGVIIAVFQRREAREAARRVSGGRAWRDRSET
jgi:hypothetical protein